MARLLVSPDAIIRFMLGKIWIHTGSGPNVYETDKLELLSFLGYFTRPAEEDEILAQADAADRAWLTSSFNALKRIGALQVATKATIGDAESEANMIDAHLAALADSVHRLATNITALGTYGAKRLETDTGSSLASRVAGLLAGSTALEAELNQLREGYLAGQLEKLQISSESGGLKLHLGCGDCRLTGWVNIDAHSSELAMDLCWTLPFRDAAADYVLISHVLEHLYYPEETLGILKEIHRVLSPSGRLRVIVPDIGRCIEAYTKSDTAFFSDRRRTWTWWPETHTRLESFLTYAGAGPRPSHFLDAHKFGYDFETLEYVLREAGFACVEPSCYMQSRDPVLRVDDVSAVAGAKSGDTYYSLFVEATP